ncbi:hypothetical protein [Metabacillus niabensis]|uniref:hypothetical protein n=1 Tax=Metabacillus niabensis TaxID=324854 RepID=UPI001CFA0D6F|nr:hypothetical protein [Metabacillus niabensis]
MKLLGVVVFIFFLTILTNVAIDLLAGYTLLKSLNTILKTFTIIGAGEYLMLIFLVCIIIGNQIFLHFKKESKKIN